MCWVAGGALSSQSRCLSRRSEISLEKLGHIENMLQAFSTSSRLFLQVFKNIFYSTKINVNESAWLGANNSISISIQQPGRAFGDGRAGCGDLAVSF